MVDIAAGPALIVALFAFAALAFFALRPAAAPRRAKSGGDGGSYAGAADAGANCGEADGGCGGDGGGD
jgi:hypothetical protein